MKGNGLHTVTLLMARLIPSKFYQICLSVFAIYIGKCVLEQTSVLSSLEVSSTEADTL